MNTIRKLRSPWVIVTLLLASYVTSYFAASEHHCVVFTSGLWQSFGNQFHSREFKHAWMVHFYWPMAYVESKVRGEPVSVWSDDPSSPWSLHPPRMPITDIRN